MFGGDLMNKVKDFFKKYWWKFLLTVGFLVANIFVGAFIAIWLVWGVGVDENLAYGGFAILPTLLFPLVWTKKEKWKKCFIGWLIFIVVYIIVLSIPFVIEWYEDSITIEEYVNINTEEYMPFDENSKIAVLDEESTLKLTENLPIVDGAAAFFPVYSAYVNAVYPSDTQLNSKVDNPFQYNNTYNGYYNLGRKKTDIFFGVYPSEDQIDYAEDMDTKLVFTPIGDEAFVFFTHKDNPVDNLTIEQVKGIYSGEITNWKELGGKNMPIKAYQRNIGSGSQSMMERFMGDTPLMKPPSEYVQGLMSGIIEVVTDYQNRNSAIGFSYRFYLTGIIANPDVKILKINGVEPTNENIRNGSYPITTPIYAVTYEGQENENVQKLLDWVLGPQGQELLEKSGYVSINGMKENE